MLKEMSVATRTTHVAVALASTFLMADVAYGADPPQETLETSINQTLTAGQSISGAFDLQPYQLSGGQSFNLSDFQVTVTGNSPEVVANYSLQVGPYELYAIDPIYTIHGYAYTNYYFTRSESEVYADPEPATTLTLEVGSDQSSVSDTYNNIEGPYLETGETTTGNATGGQNVYISNTNIDNVGYFGSMSTTLQPSAATTASINKSGYLDYTIKDSGGSSEVYNVSVSFEATPAVPEPATWLWMLAGFGAIGIRLRRRILNGERTPQAAARSAENFGDNSPEA